MLRLASRVDCNLPAVGMGIALMRSALSHKKESGNSGCEALYQRDGESNKHCHRTYDEIYRDMQGRTKLAFDVRKKQLELAKQELAFLIESRKKLGAAIGLTPEQAKAVIQLSRGTSDTKSDENELGTVKVMLSLVRRIIGLSKFEQNGRAKF
jgi:hypothetical protein